MATTNATTGVVSIDSPRVSTDKALRQKIKALPEQPREIAMYLRKTGLDFDTVAESRSVLIREKRQKRLELKSEKDPDLEEIQEIEKQINAIEKLRVAAIPLKNTWDSVAAWLASKSPDDLGQWKGSIPKDIDVAAKRVTAKKAERIDTERAPISTADAKARALADVEELIKAGEPDILNTTKNSLQIVHTNPNIPGGIRRKGGGIIWPSERIKQKISRNRHRNVETDTDHFVFAGLAFAAWLNQDQLRSRVSKMFDGLGKTGLTNEQRSWNLKVLNAELIELQYQLGAATWKAIKDGVVLAWPHDLPPACVLGLVPTDNRVDMARFLNVRASDE